MTIASFTITQRDLISFIIIAPDFFFIVISSSSFHTAMLSDNWIHEIYRHGFCFLLIFIILFRPFLFSLHSFAFSICNNKSFPVGIKWNSPLQWRLYAAASSCGNNLSLNLNYKFSRVIFEDFVELNSLALVVSWLPRIEIAGCRWNWSLFRILFIHNTSLPSSSYSFAIFSHVQKDFLDCWLSEWKTYLHLNLEEGKLESINNDVELWEIKGAI